MADIKKIKLGDTTYDIVDAGAARQGEVITVVSTEADVPNNELGLYRYTTSEGKASNLVEVVSTQHEGGSTNTFTKTTTANNQSIAASAILDHFDTVLSNFVTVTAAAQVYTLYQAFNNKPVISGLRLGSSKNQGSLTLNFLQGGKIIVSKYFTINGSTGEVASSDILSQVIVDGTTYMLASESDFVEIPVTAGTHTITSGSEASSRAILIGFSFGSSGAFSTYEKKYLARQEDLDSLTETVTKHTDEATLAHTDFESRITKNTQDITVLDTAMGDVQIFEVQNNLPKASMNHLDKIYRKSNTLYQCVKAGDGVHKEFVFNLSGTSEILETHLEQLYPTIAKDFTDYFTLDLENSSKVFRNNGSIKLGSSSTSGILQLIGQESRALTSLKIGVKAYNANKSAFSIEVDTEAFTTTKQVLVEDAANETLIDFTADIQENGSSLLNYIQIATSDSYTDTKTETSITTDNRGIITCILADFGDVSYKWVSFNEDIKVTYAELLTLRNSARLIPGQWYRITDYRTCASNAAGGISVWSSEQPFDIIVQALSACTLSEDAKADYHIQEDGSIVDNYFVTAETAVYIEPKYAIYEDADGSPVTDKDPTYVKVHDIFISATYEENPDGDIVPTLRKTDIIEYPDEVDSEDSFYYKGTYELEGKTYDMWQKVELGEEDNNYGWEAGANPKKYILTDTIIEDGQFTDKIYKSILKKHANIPAWKLKYCLDNDISRFDWAAPEGYGVIYYMKDEWNNECPYDFKSIKFSKEGYGEVYTFSWINEDNQIEDLTLKTLYTDNADRSLTHNNRIAAYYDTTTGKQRVNEIAFINRADFDNGLFYGCTDNTFESNCFNMTFLDDCISNTFGTSCNSNTFKHLCSFNSFGSFCSNINFERNCQYNTLGSYCSSISLDEGCINNSFGNVCTDISLYQNCGYNDFGQRCEDISLGTQSDYNVFGTYCNNLQFSYRSNLATIKYFVIGSYCAYVNLNRSTALTSSIRHVVLGPGIRGSLRASLVIDDLQDYTTYELSGTTHVILDVEGEL